MGLKGEENAQRAQSVYMRFSHVDIGSMLFFFLPLPPLLIDEKK